MRRSSLRLVVSILLAMIMPSLAWASLGPHGHGSPSPHCDYNQDPQREFEPRNIVKAQENLEKAKKKLEKIEKELEEADDCEGCAEIVENALIAVVGEENVENYQEHLRGDPHCFLSSNSAVSYYNSYASLMGWEKIQKDYNINQKPSRMIAGGGSSQPVDSSDRNPGGGSGGPGPQERRGDSGGGEVGSGGGGTGADGIPDVTSTVVGPSHRECQFTGPNETLDVEICDLASERGAFSRRGQIDQCKKCIGPNSRGSDRRTRRRGGVVGGNIYGKCLKKIEQLEQALFEAEDLVAEREEELAEAEENPSSATVCVDCMKDPTPWWQKALPTGAVGLMVYAAARYAANQEKSAFEDSQRYYREVVHPDNNAKGYPTEPNFMRDTSGQTFATIMVNGTPLIVNTAASTGLLGCAGGSMFGNGTLLAGPHAGMQIAGATSYPSSMIDSILGPQNGGQVINGMHIPGAQMSPDQIYAQMQRSQQQAAYLEQVWAQQQAINQIQSDSQARINAVVSGSPILRPGGGSVFNSGLSTGALPGIIPGSGSRWGNQNSVLEGGIRVSGGLGVRTGSGFDVFSQNHMSPMPSYQPHPTSFDPRVPNSYNTPPGGNFNYQNPAPPGSTAPANTPIGL